MRIAESEDRHNDELLEFYDKPDTIQTLKPRRLGWAGEVVNGGAKTPFKV